MTATIQAPAPFTEGEAGLGAGHTAGPCAGGGAHGPGQTPQGEVAAVRANAASPRPADPFGHHEFELWLAWADDGHDGEE